MLHNVLNTAVLTNLHLPNAATRCGHPQIALATCYQLTSAFQLDIKSCSLTSSVDLAFEVVVFKVLLLITCSV